MALPEGFRFTEPKNGTPTFYIAHNLRTMFNVTIAHIDAQLRLQHFGRTLFEHRFTEQFDLKSAQRAYAMTYEQALTWCDQHGRSLEALLTEEAFTDENRRHVPRMIELGDKCLELYPPTPEDHIFLGPVTIPQTGIIFDSPRVTSP